MQFPALTVCNVTCKVYTSLLAKTYFLLYLLSDLGSYLDSKSNPAQHQTYKLIPTSNVLYPQKEKKGRAAPNTIIA